MKTTKQLTARDKRHRKFLLVLPLLALPFITMAFWAMGGGKKTTGTPVVQSKGLNTSLPGAQLTEEKNADKMSIYEQAMRDSAHRDTGGFGGLKFKTDDPAAIHEQEISERLDRINQELSKPQSYTSPVNSGKSDLYDDGNAAQVAKLEKLMKNLGENKQADPEMTQLADVLEKIQQIQNPDLAKQNQPKAIPVIPDSAFHAIPAMIASNQKAMQGSVIELVLLDSVTISGQTIPKGHLLYGLAAFSNQRLNLEIKNIRLGTSIIPVNLTVFDKRDAMTGINAPEALLTEAIGNGSSDAMSSIGLMGVDQTLTTQLAGAGIDAAKGLLSKKLKRIKQPLKKGYPLLLRDNQAAQQINYSLKTKN